MGLAAWECEPFRRPGWHWTCRSNIFRSQESVSMGVVGVLAYRSFNLASGNAGSLYVMLTESWFVSWDFVGVAQRFTLVACCLTFRNLVCWLGSPFMCSCLVPAWLALIGPNSTTSWHQEVECGDWYSQWWKFLAGTVRQTWARFKG